MVRTGSSADLLQSAPRRPERFVAVVGKPGRGLCRDVALHLDLVVLATQLHKLPSFKRAQRVRIGGRRYG